MSARPRIRRQRLGLGRILISSVLALAAITLGTWTVMLVEEQDGYPKDMQGNPVVAPRVPASFASRVDADPSVDSQLLSVPSVGLEVPLGELNEVDGVINPPGFRSAYLVRNYGASLDNSAQGAVYVAMHSCRGGAVCPGNYLINAQDGSSATQLGADIYIAGLHYKVTGWEKVPKPDVHSDQSIWANRPGRLILLTCLQNPQQNNSVDNMIIDAQLVQ